MYYMDIYETRNMEWLDRYEPKVKKHPRYGEYLQIEVTRRQRGKIASRLKRNLIRYRIYEDRWERSNTYRNDFFTYYRPPYRCRYCHRRLKKEYLVVDHIVPVGKVKKSVNARNLLYIRGISDVNDCRNLAPSCQRCNLKKSDKLGLWYIKGILGQWEWYWVVRKILLILIFVAVMFACYKYM